MQYASKTRKKHVKTRKNTYVTLISINYND
jgi:hypothetical protein